MIPTIAIPVPTQAPQAVQTAFLSGVPTETSATARLPTYAVPSSVSAVPVYHNGRGSAAYQPVRATALLPTVAQAQTDGFSLQSEESPPPAVVPYTSAFMAQVIGQSDQPPANMPLVQFFFQSLTQDQKNALPEVPAGFRPAQRLQAQQQPVQQLQQGLNFAGRQLQDEQTTPQTAASNLALVQPKTLVRASGLAGYQASHWRSQIHLKNSNDTAEQNDASQVHAA